MNDFVESLRQALSHGYDKLTDQSNIYHRSSGKTQKEYKQDIEFYKNLEDATRKSAVILGALDGAVASGGIAAAEGLPLWLAGTNIANNAWLGHLVPWLGAGIEKNLDNEANGFTPSDWRRNYYFRDKNGVIRDKSEYYYDENGDLKKKKGY